MQSSALRLIGVSLLLLGLWACDTADESASSAREKSEQAGSAVAADSEPDPRWRTHLDSWPRGETGSRSPLVFRFTHPVVEQNALNEPQKSVVKLRPERPFTAVFTARDRLEIRPLEPLRSDQSFTVTLFPQGLSGVDDSLPPLETRLTVLRQQLTIRVEALAPAEGSDTMILKGRIDTLDLVDNQALESVLSAKQSEMSLPIVWEHPSAGLTHRFQVTGIRRDVGEEVRLAWDGEPVGESGAGERSYSVPRPGQFAVTSVRSESFPDRHVVVQFSEALQAGQDFLGMVALGGKSARVQVDGSRLLVYPSDEVDEKAVLQIAPGVVSASRHTLEKMYRQSLVLSMAKPAVRFVGEGAILPRGEVLSVPFEAAAAGAIQVQAFEVFENNITSYLQSRDLENQHPDTRSGRYLWQKTLELPPSEERGWQRYRLDLTELMAKHPNGLVLLTLKVDPRSIHYQCGDGGPRRENTLPDNYEGPGQDDEVSRYYHDAGYLRWDERDNPCSDSYYAYNNQAESSRSFIASNLGLLAKQGEDDRMLVVTTALDTNTPLAGTQVTAYNYQHQSLGSASSGDNGIAELKLSGTPFYLVAKNGKEKGYLKVARNRALPSNQFDTGGERVLDGLKGFFYGERDVWRPGDDIHLTFVLDDPQQRMPADHPVTVDWFDPRGNKVASYTNDEPVNGFYTFTLKTGESAPTGNWRAVARLGERDFDTRLRVEAIKPNRLRIELTAPEQVFAGQSTPLALHGQWLNGARASALKADVKVRLLNGADPFPGYAGYTFKDPSRTLQAEPFTAFEGRLDDAGDATVNLAVPAVTPPGMAAALVTTRIFENGGDYSTQVQRLPVAPYRHWVGLRVPEGDGWGGALGRDQNHNLDLLTLDQEGQPESRSVTLSVYRIDWRWWWDRGANDLANFISNPHTRKVKATQLTTNDKGRVQWRLNGPDYDWGRYLVRVCDDKGGHCAARTVYLGWSGQRGGGGDAASRLALSTDKEQYQVGEMARVKVPVSGAGRLLVSLESGSRVLRHYWVKPGDKENFTLEIPVTADMAPNVYVHATLLQAHKDRDNDRPIRLYGIVPLLVEDPDTRLEPDIEAPEEVRPESELTVTVSEKQGRAMTYTLAVVDEGLLGLTNFQTPNPHQTFFRREALGVLTWDLFDQVVGAYGGELERMLAVGGSEGLMDGSEAQRRRFPPVVYFAGPFELKAKSEQEHKVQLPAYMGEVRVMVVAGHRDGQQRAYGKADTPVTVTQPLTLLSTLPRVLGPGESLQVPVNVFATEDTITDVDLNLEAEPPLKVTRDTARLTFEEPGDKIATLSLEAGDQVGIARVTVSAKAGKEQAGETVNLPIRTANPPTSREQLKVLEPGDSWALDWTPHGLPGTNQSALTVSSLPAMGLERRLEYLIRYPHGCVEQTTSTVLPQLYLHQLVGLSDAQKQEVQNNIAGAIDRLRRFQLNDGAFSYWPGSGQASDWGTSYAGHFLVEARRLGYAVPAQMIDGWRNYQRRLASDPGQYAWQWASQAYRLYTLALAGEPEVGAMNRLRGALAVSDSRNQHGRYTARWLLAAAYQQMGLTDVAGELIAIDGEVGDYDEPGPTFGSALRDRAISMMVLEARGDQARAWDEARVVADDLASDRWFSTQSLAWSLMAMARFAGDESAGDGYDLAWRQGEGDWRETHATSPVFQQPLEIQDDGESIVVRNDSDRRLFATMTTVGTPAPGQEKAVSEGLDLSVTFLSMDGSPLDPARLTQGTDFRARVKVTNRTNRRLENLALTQIVPSGWQIASRLSSTGVDDAKDEKETPLDYQDVRDDRVLSYFSLKPGATRTVNVELNASFAGRFYLPGWQVEAMYQGFIQSRKRGQWVEVVAE